MNEPLATLQRARIVATGSDLTVSTPDVAPTCTTESQFERLVIDYYRFFNEELSGDAAFLQSVRVMRYVKEVRELLYHLRTSIAHSDNQVAHDAAEKWRAAQATPQAAADALASALTQALRDLASMAVQVSRDPSLSRQWRQVLDADVASIFDAVAADLGRDYHQNNRLRMIRNVRKRAEVRPPKQDHRTAIADYCAQEMLSQRRPLPVPYGDVLDALGIIGKPMAVGVLLTAYAVAEINNKLPADEFVNRVRDTWLKAAAG